MCWREIVMRESRERDAVLELMRGHWDCLEAGISGDETLWALELALRDEPLRSPTR